MQLYPNWSATSTVCAFPVSKNTEYSVQPVAKTRITVFTAVLQLTSLVFLGFFLHFAMCLTHIQNNIGRIFQNTGHFTSSYDF